MFCGDSCLMTNTTDPRPLYHEALAWTTGLIEKVREDQLTASTPCADFDVRTLLGHLVATVERARVIGEGGDPSTVPLVVTDFPATATRTPTGPPRTACGPSGPTTAGSTRR